MCPSDDCNLSWSNTNYLYQLKDSFYLMFYILIPIKYSVIDFQICLTLDVVIRLDLDVFYS